MLGLQESALPSKLRVGEALELYASFYDTPADPGALLDELGLDDVRDTPYGINDRAAVVPYETGLLVPRGG